MTTKMMDAIDELRSEVKDLAEGILKDPRLNEIKRRLTVLNGLEDLSSQPKTALSALFNFGGVASETDIVIEPDEFHGKEALDAAKRYLKKRGSAGDKSALFQDILAAIRRGGGDPGNEDKLKVSLAKSTWDVTKIGEDRFGLLEFFPDIKRGAKKKKPGNGDSVPQDEPRVVSTEESPQDKGAEASEPPKEV
jgi:hypothetical protein